MSMAVAVEAMKVEMNGKKIRKAQNFLPCEQLQ